MLAGKMQEIKKSIKRVYTRFVVLTMVVVFGAIAIAQSQRDHVGAATAADTSDSSAAVTARPLPLANDAFSATDAEPAAIAVDGALPLADSGSRSVRQATWNGQEPDESTASSDETEPADDEFASPPPMLPDPVSYDPPPPSDNSTRRNPYRGGETLSETSPADPDFDDLPADDSTLDDSIQYAAAADEAAESGAAGDAAPPLLPDADEEPSAESAFDEDTAEAPIETAQDEPRSRFTDDPAPTAFESAEPESPVAEAESADSSPSRYSESAASLPPADAATANPVRQPARDRAATSRSGSRFGQREQIEDAVVPEIEVARRSDIQASGKPGPQTLEGPQTPTLTLQKIAPEEIQVGRPAKFEIRVRNVGRASADNVLVRDEIPAGTSFVDSSPQASRAADGEVYWEVGSLAPGQEVVVSMQLMPESEGQIGSVATVSFEASASARTLSTKPGLVLEHSGPIKVLLGDAVRFSIKLSNPGTGAATNVVLEEEVPSGLSHSSGAKLEYAVGSIEPGQTRHLELTLKAAQAGHVINKLIAKADAGLQTDDVVELDVVAPQLQVAVEGPNRRYLDRQATFTVAVANPGTAPASEVELVAHLPEGLKFVSANNSGYYDQSRNAVVWSLEQLPAGEMGRAQFIAMPVTMGSFQIRAEAHAKAGLEAHQEHPIEIEGLAALLYALTDKVDPIEINGQTTYEIRVVNQGSKEAIDVRFTAQIPEGMRVVGVAGPTQEEIQGQQVAFAPIEKLPPKSEAVFEITVQGEAAGDHRFRVQMTSQETETPVIKEESTRVYAD